MKRLVVLTVLAAGLFLAVRKLIERAGPAMGERCSDMCERMLANMPDSFPPNRMMADLESIKEQNARIDEALKERLGEAESTNADTKVSSDNAVAITS